MIRDSIIDHHMAQVFITDESLSLGLLDLGLPLLALGALPDARLGCPGGLRVVVHPGAQALALVMSVPSAPETAANRRPEGTTRGLLSLKRRQ